MSTNTATTLASTQEQIQNLLSQMTLAEKIGQMTQPEKNSVKLEDITTYGLGSILSGGGGTPDDNTARGWLDMVNGFQEYALKSRLGIPLIYGVDAVHGHNNVTGATIFPHNIALGATRDADLVERIGRATAVEVAATGIQWDFAPAVSVPQDIRWGRTYEGYSENTDIVGELGAAYVRGLQGELSAADGVLASVKHFVGDGGTGWGTISKYEWIDLHLWSNMDKYPKWQIDQALTVADEETLRQVHLAPYADAIEAGALNVMASYSSWEGLKMHAHKYLLTDVLKGELGFAGFIVSDWMAIDQIAGDYYDCVVQSINAGLDMIMVPYDYVRFIETLTQAVEKGDVAESRIDDAVSRILLAKFALGVFDRPLTDDSTLDRFGCDEHRALAREAVQKSQTLLKNDGDLLPLPKSLSHLLLAGQAADDVGLQCGGWTIEWQGGTGNITSGTTMLQALEDRFDGEVLYAADGQFPVDTKSSIGLVVLAEKPYAEGEGDTDDLRLSAEQIELLERVRPLCDQLVVVLMSGRPLVITDQLPLIDALVAAWLPGTEGDGVIDVLFGDVPFQGKSAYTWPRSMDQLPLNGHDSAEPPLFPFGAGIVK